MATTLKSARAHKFAAEADYIIRITADGLPADIYVKDHEMAGMKSTLAKISGCTINSIEAL